MVNTKLKPGTFTKERKGDELPKEKVNNALLHIPFCQKYLLPKIAIYSSFPSILLDISPILMGSWGRNVSALGRSYIANEDESEKQKNEYSS